jgi:hypothetical protein
MMKKLMEKIMLTCRESTFYSAVKGSRKLKLIESVQHRLHMMVCKPCRQFDIHSQQIDHSIHDFLFNEELISEENLSKEKKSQIENTVNQAFR